MAIIVGAAVTYAVLYRGEHGLNGRWKVVVRERKGRVEPRPLRWTEVVITGRNVTLRQHDKVAFGIISIDTRAAPKRIDIRGDIERNEDFGFDYFGIYCCRP